MKAVIYNQQGEKSSSMELPEELFGVKWNGDLVHQVVLSMQANARTPVAHTKDRSEVSGTGRKPWRQKGSGRARHGSRLSPIWVGGGVAHGPTKERNFSQKINRKMKAKALACVLSQKMADNEIILVDQLRFEEPKTGQAKKILQALASVEGFEDLVTKKRNAACVAIVSSEDEGAKIRKSFRNLGQLRLSPVDSLNPVLLLNHRYLIIEKPEQSLPSLAGRLN